ncbi:MAG: hypothetical protein Q9M31_10020 [Mariprofundus sp.]|nr:hypothetical protein [Mariprofundus sp.]
MLVLKDRSLFYHYLGWVLSHPRFGFAMIALTLFSFTHNRWVALALFIIFAVEITLRIMMNLRQGNLNPYRGSLKRKIDLLFLAVDIIAVSSLLITIFGIDVDAENMALARLLRATYLLRTLRVFRYFDLHSAMFSPTYGMLTSLIILISFFAAGTFLWIIIFFFFIELSLRWLVIRDMEFDTPREKKLEWMFWWVDVVATTFMLPWIAGVPYSSTLRLLRLARLLKPWRVIISNLRDVLREGQFMQEINLIVLILAILSIAGGVIAHNTFGVFDYNLGKTAEPQTDLLSAIWFSFRLLTDPGNSVVHPANMAVAAYNLVAVIMGVFVFAFFIGIGANIVSGLMRRLRNEELVITNHLVILGWSPAAPYIMAQLRNVAARTFAKLKVVMLHSAETPPPELLEEKWVMYRHGDIEASADLKRVNIAAAKQALIILPEKSDNANALAHSFYSLMAVRMLNREINLSFAIPGMSEPALDTHKHMLQVGWDNHGKYDKPTVVLAEADFRATALCNILRYSDFDQVMSRLLIPELLDESAMQLSEWNGLIMHDEAGEWALQSLDEAQHVDLNSLSLWLFRRGVILIGYINDEWEPLPIYHLEEVFRESVTIKALFGVAISDEAFYEEILYGVSHPERVSKDLAALENVDETLDLDDYGLALEEPENKMSLMVVGWVGSLPLLLKRLLRFYNELDLIIFDDITAEESFDMENYLRRRLAEEPGLDELVNIKIESWNFFNMEALRSSVKTSNHIILSRPQHKGESSYALTTTALSHIVTMTIDEEVAPQIFPIMENRDHASLLQSELAEFETKAEIHVTVMNEFYGVYVAHTTYHMYTANEDCYELKRALRHVITKLMSDSGEDSDMGMHIYRVTKPLPADAGQLFDTFRRQNKILVGYTLKHPYEWQAPIQKVVQTLFPRPGEFSCQRQKHIIINPFSNPVNAHSWKDNRDDIVELISIGGADDIELF